VSSIHVCDFAVNCIARTLNIELRPWHIPNTQIRCGAIKTTRGLETTAEIVAYLQRPEAELYRQSLSRWSKDMVEFDQKRTETDKVAQVVQKALCARNPKPRYSIGYMAGAAAIIESLPQPLVDAILKMLY
jgi:hypothetical protein